MLGTIIMDEQIYVVESIRISDGAFQIEAWCEGPVRVEKGRLTYRLHGDDGEVVLTAIYNSPEMIEAEKGDVVQILTTYQVTGVTDDAVERGYHVRRDDSGTRIDRG